MHAFEVFSEQKDSEEYLHGAKSLALRLMAPWLVNVAITQEDLEEKGIFIQLLSATFAHTALSRDFISSWSSLAAQPGNIKIATNFLMAALARCPQAFALTAEISSAMYIINARETLEPLLSQLTEQGFEWNRVLVRLLFFSFLFFHLVKNSFVFIGIRTKRPNWRRQHRFTFIRRSTQILQIPPRDP